MKETRSAWINWSEDEHKWVLRLWLDDEWAFSKSWKPIVVGHDEMWDEPVEAVHDSIICEIAHLQQLGYEVKVTV